MSHLSRLTQSLCRQQLDCIICGCTQDDPCILPDGSACSWTSPGLCSNPECIEAMAEELAHGQLLDPLANAGRTA